MLDDEPSPRTPGGSGRRRSHVRGAPLSSAGLVALTFFSVTGGPFGQELIVKAGGPFYALLAYALMTLLWSVPEAIMTAELSSAFPEAAGFAAWTNAAFGPLAAWVDAWCSWVSGVVDNAVYPLFFLEYVSRTTDLLDGLLARWLFVLAFVGSLTYLCHRGLDLTGRSALWLLALVIAPFAALVMAAAPRVEPSRWVAAPAWSAVHFRALVNNVFWNVNYFDSASAWAADVDRSRWTSSMLVAVLLCAGTSLLPMLAATGASSRPREEYHNGSYVDLAREIGGPVLSAWVVLASALSMVGQFVSEMSSDSYQLSGMAERGLLPAFLARKSVYGTPTAAILFSATGVLALHSLTFEAIVATENLLYVVAVVLELAAFLKLRQGRGAGDAPSAVPISNGALAALVVPAMVLLSLVAAVQPAFVWLLAALLLGLGLLVYFAIGHARRSPRLQFFALHPDWSAAEGSLAELFGWSDTLADDPRALGLYDENR